MRSHRSLAAFLPLILAAAHAQDKAKSGAADNAPQVYRNATFGFRYRIPYGWVDRTKEMQDADKKTDETSKTESRKQEVNGEVLLAVFERPPEAAGDTVNSAVVIASENVSDYPGLKSADDYLDQLDEITTAKGFKPDGDPQVVTIDGRELVGADFIKVLNDKLTMYQSTLVLLTKKQVVSFTFIAGSKDEVNELIEDLSFAAAPVQKRK